MTDEIKDAQATLTYYRNTLKSISKRLGSMQVWIEEIDAEIEDVIYHMGPQPAECPDCHNTGAVTTTSGRVALVTTPCIKCGRRQEIMNPPEEVRIADIEPSLVSPWGRSYNQKEGQ